MEALFLNLLNATINASWVVAVVLLLRVCLQKAPKYIRCLLWATVALRLLLPFSIESAFSLLPSSQTVPNEIIYATVPTVDTGVPVIDAVVNPIITDTLAPQAGESVNPVQVLLTIGGYVWLLGLVVMAVYATVSYLLVRRQVREAALLRDNIYLCDHIQTPFILGIFRPRIYLPSAMNEDDRTYVIAHEQAHLSRRDHWWKPLGFLLLTIYWFNPLLWVAYILLCRDIELACDEKVLADCGEEKKDYADALINCSAPRHRIAACPLAFGETSVKGRIKSVLHYKKPAFWVIVVALLACVAVAVCFLTDPKDEWQSQNYGIVGVSSGAECENVGFHYREGSINSENPYITVTLKNDTDDTLCFTQYFTLSRDGDPCPEVEARMWEDILYTLLPSGETSQTYSLGCFDLSQSGSYRLETELYCESDPTTKHTAYVNFTIDRMYSFVGWQYAGEGVIYGDADNAAYTDGTVPNVYITEDSVRLQIAENGEWKEIGELRQDKLDRTMFDYMLTEDWWDAGYSAKLLRKNNKHMVSYVDSGANERYYLLEQQNGEIYLAIGTVSKLNWIFRLTPVGQTSLIGQPTSPPTRPPTGPLTVLDCIVDPESLGGYEGISFDCVGCEEKDGRLYMRVRWENRTDKTITFDPSFTLSQGGKTMFPPEGYGWDAVLYEVKSGDTFLETLDISACVAKGEYKLTKYFNFSPTTEQPISFPQSILFTIPETRKTTAVPQTTTSTTKVVSTPDTPSFSGTVLQVAKGRVLLEIDKVQAGGNISGKVWVNTAVQWSHPVPTFKVGMKVDVLYDGMVQETYPLQIPNVYTICDCEYQVHHSSTTPTTKPTTTTTTTTSIEKTPVPTITTTKTTTATIVESTAATTIPTTVTTATTRPTLGTQKTRFGGDDFRDDIVLQTEQTVYALNETLYFTLTNHTGEDIGYGEQYYLLRQVDGEQWIVYPNTTGTWKAILYRVGVDGVSKRNAVKLSQYSLTAGQSYKVALQIGGKWVVSNEFTLVEAVPMVATTTTTHQTTLDTMESRLDVELRIDKPTYAINENIQVELENKTGGQLSFTNQYVVLQQTKMGTWKVLYASSGHHLQHALANGKVHNATVDLSLYDLEVGQPYKLALSIDGKWLTADFSTTEAVETATKATTTTKGAYFPQR